VAWSSGAVVGTTLSTPRVPAWLVEGGVTEATPEVPASVFCAELSSSWDFWSPDGSSSTTVSGPLAPSPKPSAMRS
jgi:hypothetical protein